MTCEIDDKEKDGEENWNRAFIIVFLINGRLPTGYKNISAIRMPQVIPHMENFKTYFTKLT